MEQMVEDVLFLKPTFTSRDPSKMDVNRLHFKVFYVLGQLFFVVVVLDSKNDPCLIEVLLDQTIGLH